MTKLPTSSKAKDTERRPGLHEFRLFDTARLVTVDKDGSYHLGPNDYFPAQAPFNGRQHMLTISMDGTVVQEPITPGITVILGGTKKGKSTFVSSFSNVHVAQVVEPYDDLSKMSEDTAYDSIDAALIDMLAHHARQSTDKLWALDSLRAPLFETSGSASSKGIIMPFFTKLTRVSNRLASAGVCALATINPMEEDDAFVESFSSKLSASSQAYMVIESAVGDVFSGTYHARGGKDHRKTRRFQHNVKQSRDADVAAPVSLRFAPAAKFVPALFSNQSLNSLEG